MGVPSENSPPERTPVAGPCISVPHFLEGGSGALLLTSRSQLGICFGFFLFHKAGLARGVGLLHGALGMDAVARVRGFATDGADLAVLQRQDSGGLLLTHR